MHSYISKITATAESKQLPLWRSLLFTAIVLFSASCSLITETDISNEEVILLSPVDGMETPTQNHTFWWNYVTDAGSYNLLIVSPAFDSIARLVVDTNLSGNKFNYSLVPGNYEWAVSAFNSASATAYSIFSITIDTSSNLTYQTVVLTDPPQDFTTNKPRITFRWDALAGVTGYRFTIRDSSWNSGQNVINVLDTTGTEKIVTLNDEGYYEWGVQAYDDLSNTNTYWNTRRLILDFTPPAIPVITTPQAQGDSLLTDPYNITWRRPEASIAAIRDSLLIATDSTFTPVSIVESRVITSTEFSVSALDDGKYYVKIKSFDLAGNQSTFSDWRRFYLYKEE